MRDVSRHRRGEKMENENKSYNPFEVMSFTYDRCFLCGEKILNNDSVEHIFPKWLQHKFNLWNQSIALLNQTTIKYKNLVIPCCLRCNNNYLSNIEKVIKDSFEQGFEAFSNLDELIIFQWISKISYGLLFKELSLLADRRDKSKGFITTPSIIERYRDLHAFLQSVRSPIKFEEFVPWSIFLFETMEFGDSRDFDYFDGFETMTFAMRMGKIGVIACLEDSGSQKEATKEYISKFKGVKLHPIQFDEMVSRVVYSASLLNRTPKYISLLPNNEGMCTYIISHPLQGLSSKPIYNEWAQKDYARHLAFFWSKYGINFDNIFIEPDKVLTMIDNQDGSIKKLNLDGEIIYDKEIDAK